LTCPEDCPSACNDDVCQGLELIECPQDCPDQCGDGLCQFNPEIFTCAQDCPGL
jgi:hypothetical protein